MGFELERKDRYRCPCGKGQIIEGHYSDDWFRSEKKHTIECDDCNKKYHIEEMNWFKNDGEWRTTHYLVPNGETIQSDCSRSFNTRETPFYEILCMFNKKSDLGKGHEVLKESKYYSRLEDSIANGICLEGKKYLGTVKPNIIAPYVLEAIEKYDAVDTNYEKYLEFSKTDKERIADVKSRSIPLYDLE